MVGVSKLGTMATSVCSTMPQDVLALISRVMNEGRGAVSGVTCWLLTPHSMFKPGFADIVDVPR
jgi:hypothetical protein